MPQGTPHSLTHAVTWLNLPSAAWWAVVTESLSAQGQMRERCLTERVSALEWKALLKKEAFCNAEDRNVIRIKPKTFRKLIPWLSCDCIL